MLSQAQAQRRTIERVTGVEVEPLIVFSRAWVDRPGARRKGVRVLPARMLLSFLGRQPARLSQEEIERRYRLVAQALLEHHRRAPAANRRWSRARDYGQTAVRGRGGR
jgi:hypothetical protein